MEKSSSNEPIFQYDVFISYRWVLPDQNWVREILAPKLRDSGLRVCLDVNDFVPGRDLILEMDRAGRQSRRVLCVLSPDYFDGSRAVYLESLAARARDPAGKHSTLIPLIYRPTTLPKWLANIVYVDWTDPSSRAREWEKLLAVLGIAPGVTPQLELPATSPIRIPNNLPRHPYFVGRESELAIVAEALAPEVRNWGVIITGEGGIGKTALAVRAAELAPRRFRRVVFLSAKQRDLSASGVHNLAGDFVLQGYLEMLNAIALEIGLPELKQSPDSERAALLRRELEELNALLVLDNLEALTEDDRERLFTFLNRLPRGCNAIVTSRFGNSEAGARSLPLGRLDERDALRLIDSLAVDNPVLIRATARQRKELYQNTAGNPLLIRWVVGQLGLGRCSTIATALRVLETAPPSANPLEYIFSQVWDDLPVEPVKALALLCHFAGAVKVEFLAELMKLDELRAGGVFALLVQRSLVVSDSEQRRLELAPLVAQFLRRKSPQVVEQAGQTLEDYAFQLVMDYGHLNFDRYPHLEARWAIVEAALPLFLIGPNQRLQTICDALHVFLEFTGHWDEWLSLNEKAEARAVEEGDLFEAGWRALQSGRVYRLQRREKEVLVCADRADQFWEETRKPGYRGEKTAGAREKGDVCTLRAKGLGMLREYPQAIACFEAALQTLEENHRASRDYTSALNGLADAERHSGNWQRAEELYAEALSIAREINSLNDIAAYTGNLAALAIDRQDPVVAEALARQALELAKKVGRQESIAADYFRLAEALTMQNRIDEARENATKAEEIYRRLGSAYERYRELSRSIKEIQNETDGENGD